jgi:hypothetical protein
MSQMRKVHVRRYLIPAAVLAALGLLFWTGCSKNLMDPDVDPPRDSMITNPLDNQSLNKSVINVRGRAEGGATVDIYVNDVHGGSAISSPSGDQPYDGLGGRFTVEDVVLGEEGQKVLRAKITDLYGNVATAAETPVITIWLDQTPPPVSFEGMQGADWVDTLGYWGSGYWQSGLPEIVVFGKTDSTAAFARLRYGINENITETLVPDSLSSALNFQIPALSPALTGGPSDTLIIYRLEAVDAAGNVGEVPVPVHWAFEGREEELSNDDGEYDAYDHWLTGRIGDMVAVKYQAPTWANYVTKFIFYSANDQIDNPIDPQLPSTKPFTVHVWRSTVDGTPGAQHEFFVPFTDFYAYPEDEWVEATFPEAVDITNNDSFPNKIFFIGVEWDYRSSPAIYEDHSAPIDYSSFLKIYPTTTWELRLLADTMIHAVVSDVPIVGIGREAVLRIQ